MSSLLISSTSFIRATIRPTLKPQMSCLTRGHLHESLPLVLSAWRTLSCPQSLLLTASLFFFESITVRFGDRCLMAQGDAVGSLPLLAWWRRTVPSS